MTDLNNDGPFDSDGNIRLLKRGARWAIGRSGINLIERTPVDEDHYPAQALALLNIPITAATLDEYFPNDENGKRYPTFAFMYLWYAFGEGKKANGAILV